MDLGPDMQLLAPGKIKRADGWVLTSGHPYSVLASRPLAAAASELSAARRVVGAAGTMSDEAAAAILMIYRAMGQRTK